MPFAEILQPLIWAYAMDTLSLTPTPDFIVLADECKDYYHVFDESYGKVIPPEDPKFGKIKRKIHVLNPGNFSYDFNFTVIFPCRDEVSPSKVDF